MFKMCGVSSAVMNRCLYGAMVFPQVLLKVNVQISSETDSDSDDSFKYKKRCKKKKRKKSTFEEKTNRIEEFVTKLRQKAQELI